MIAKFFDELAFAWDENNVYNEDIVCKILDNAQVAENKTVLDVACGTGVLFEEYLLRKVKKVTAIDISSQMVEIAKKKANGTQIEVVCGDVETYLFTEKYDCCVIYNAFPHFLCPERLISILEKVLKEDGIITVAHSMSREDINKIHSGSAKKVSIELMEIEKLAILLEPYFDVTVCVSNEDMYQICGKKKHLNN